MSFIQNVEDDAKSVFHKILEWKHWELVLHLVLAGLIGYVLYMMVMQKGDRTTTNFLLLTIAVAITVGLHQAINLNNKMTQQTNVVSFPLPVMTQQ